MFFILAISVIDHSFITEPLHILNKEMFQSQLTLIDEFTDYGSVINHSIKSDYDYCYLKKQYLERNDYDSLYIVNEYQEEKFANQFINGHFDGFIEELTQIAQISTNNFIVLTNSGNLIQIKDFNITSIHTIPQLQTTQPIHLTVVDEQFILVIMDGFNGKISLSDDNRELKRIEFAFITNLITRVIVLNNKLYLAVKNDGLYIFNIFQSDIFMLKRVQQIFISDIVIVQDNNSSDIINIYILDYVEGISIFIYNQLTNEIQLNKEIEFINIIGHIMKLLNYSLFIIEQINKDLFYLHNIHLTNSTYYLISRYLLKGQVKDIIVNEQYILLLCDNGHYVIFHSISQQFYNTTSYQSIQIPGLKQLVKINQNEYYGITLHKLIKFSLNQKPASLWCFTNETRITQFQLEYNLQSTQCPQKTNKTDDLAMCESQFYYNILIRYSYSSQTYYIILFSVIILLIGALVFVAFNLYRLLTIKYSKDYVNNLDDKSITKNSSSTDNRTSKDMTPHYFSNSLTPNQIE